MGGAALDEQRAPARGDAQVRVADGHRPFYSYYQIGGADESDEAEDEPKKEGELRASYEGSHSLFGFVWQIARRHRLEHGLHTHPSVNYRTLIMMLSDAPRYVRRKAKEIVPGRTAEEEAGEIAGFFRSQLEK